jgi:hypothetical protein
MCVGGVILKGKIPLEQHASEVYTRTMFEKFVRICITQGVRVMSLKGWFQENDNIANHMRSDAREKWCKVSRRVDIEWPGDEYCECELWASKVALQPCFEGRSWFRSVSYLCLLIVYKLTNLLQNWNISYVMVKNDVAQIPPKHM